MDKFAFKNKYLKIYYNILCLISTIYYTIFHPAYFDNRSKFNYNRGGKLQNIIFSYEILSNLTKEDI